MAKQKRRNQETQIPLEDDNENSNLSLSWQMLIPKLSHKTPKCNNRRQCRIGKPMPTLIDLEKMFEDTDKSDQSSDCVIFENEQISAIESKATVNTSGMSSSNSISDLSSDNNTSSSYSPQVRPKRNRMSFNTDHNVVSNGRSSINLLENFDSSPFFKEEQSYAAESRECNISKVVSNNDSTDINKLVTNEYLLASQTSYKPVRSFSPLPSTSRDDVTFLKNDKRFKKSALFDSAQNEVEAIEVPCDISIDIESKDYTKDNNQNSINNKYSNLQDCNGNIQRKLNRIIESIYLTNNYESIDLTHIESEKSLTSGASQPSQFQNTQERECYMQNRNRQLQSTSDILKTTSLSRTDHCSILHRRRHTPRSVSDILIKTSLARAACPYLKYRSRPTHSISHMPKITSSSRIADNNINNRINAQNNVSQIVPSTIPVRSSTLHAFKERYKTTKNSSDVIEIPSISQKREKDIGDCPICLENLSSKSIASTLCGHVFCMQCVKTAVRSKKKCPTCRKVLKGVGYHELFL